MTAIVKAFSNAIPAISSDLDKLRTVVIFSCIGLVASLLLASYGLDLSLALLETRQAMKPYRAKAA